MRKVLCFLLSITLILSALVTTVSAKQVATENEDINLPTSFVSSVQNKSELKRLPVEVKAKSAVLMDAVSGAVLLEYNKDLPVFPASVTKIMTILLVCEAINEKKINLSDKVSCSENAASKGGSQIWLEVGEQMTVEELLRAAIIGSANDAATLLGEYVAGSETAFIDLMNKRAKELGMDNTNFENATGLDDTVDSHITTAFDVAIMSKELLKYEFIRKYLTTWMDSLRNGETELVNTNKLVRFYEGTTGLKTGTTAKAGCCVSASAKRGDLHLVAVVMGSANSTDRFETAKALLNYGFSNYTSYQPQYPESVLTEIPVLNGQRKSVTVTLPELLPVLIKKGEEDAVEVKVNIKKEINAPINKNETVGKVGVYLNKELIGEYSVKTDYEVNELGFFDSFLTVLNFLSNGKAEFPYNA